MNKTLCGCLLSTCFAISSDAIAIPFTLDFEGLTQAYPADTSTSPNIFIGQFYIGGTTTEGSLSGPDYGVTFSDGSVLQCLNSLTVLCGNVSRGGEGDPNSREGALGFIFFDTNFINVAEGFGTHLSLFYSALGANVASAAIYEGLNGTGNLLATMSLPINAGECPGYNAYFCPFGQVDALFAGTAHSVSFIHSKFTLVIDDVTFGDVPTVSVPEPAGLPLVLAGLLAIALVARRRQENQ